LQKIKSDYLMNKLSALILAGCAAGTVSAAAADVDWSKLPAASTKTDVTFTNDILPLFKASCVGCHSGNRPRAQLRLDTLEGVLKGTEKGLILTAGNSANSLLVKAASQLDSETAMPPKPRGRRGPGGGPGGPPGAGGPAMQPGGDAGPGGPGGGQPPNFGGWTRCGPRRTAGDERGGNARAQIRAARQAADRRAGRIGPRVD
jgi:hypothetical protein